MMTATDSFIAHAFVTLGRETLLAGFLISDFIVKLAPHYKHTVDKVRATKLWISSDC